MRRRGRAAAVLAQRHARAVHQRRVLGKWRVYCQFCRNLRSLTMRCSARAAAARLSRNWWKWRLATTAAAKERPCGPAPGLLRLLAHQEPACDRRGALASVTNVLDGATAVELQHRDRATHGLSDEDESSQIMFPWYASKQAFTRCHGWSRWAAVLF